jgi:two-component system sensor histidine kinase UhpB
LEVQEAERRSLARELHDELGQELTAIKLAFDNMKGHSARLAHSPEFREAGNHVERVLHRVRSMALDLRPSLLDEFGLVSAIRWYIGRQAELGKLQWSIQTELEGKRFAPEIETVCFRIAQEAVTNILKHAHATHVTFEVKVDGESLHLSIRDDGNGFDVASARSDALHGRSFGITSMEERALLLGGSLNISSALGEGTEVHLSVPLRPLAASNTHSSAHDEAD